MIKTVCIFGLGHQGKQYVKFFIKNGYYVKGITKTFETKDNIEKEFGIEVSIDYKKYLNNGIDLLVLSAYPIEIYEEVLYYSKKYDYKILSDLPITFDKILLKKYLSNEKLYLMLLETKLDFFNNFFNKNIHNIKFVNCTILQNKNNLKNQKYKKESIIVDIHYALNNLLGFKLDNLKLNFMIVDREIKNIEYLIKLELYNGDNIVYKYEDGKSLIFILNNKGIILKKFMQAIIFDNILEEILIDIKLNKRLHIKNYYKNFNYILTKLNYEKNN